MLKTYTVESVTAGHPDKVCDQMSDALLDAYLTQDPQARVAIEILGSHNLLVIGGEVTSQANVDASALVQKVYEEIGYTHKLNIVEDIVQQSPDIAQGVDTGGAGDQGIMYGYATDETPEFLPHGVVSVHALTRGLETLRRTNSKFSWLGPDGKAQVTIRDGKVVTVLVSCQHDEDISQEEIRKQLQESLLQSLGLKDSSIDFLVNPTGKFSIGGFKSDTGVTGRKIIIDTYCGLVPHGGGAFSGKDATKVDRSAAYMARFAAKNIVSNGFAKECTVSVAYAIGKAEPLMLVAHDENNKDLSEIIQKNFDFRPQAIIERLNLRRPIYRQTASYGHFGKDGLPWEEIVSL